MSLFNYLRPTRLLLQDIKPFYTLGKGKNVANIKFQNYATHARKPRSALRFTLISASVGAVVGVGYSGFTHYKINKEKAKSWSKVEEPLILTNPPDVMPTKRVIGSTPIDVKLTLFQYQTCPFCCKVRAYLDANGLSYEVVEVDAVLRQSIKWSKYKKVPILLVETEQGFLQLNDSSKIISVLSSYLMDSTQAFTEVVQYFPTEKIMDDSGKEHEEILNKYFLMFRVLPKDRTKDDIEEERKWRKWADDVLVHMLSPNVYRTMEEARQAFNWFCEVGEWRKHFPSWECSLMVNVGAMAMYLIGKRLKKRHSLKEDVRISLYDELNIWTKALKQKDTAFMGGSSPNLSDLAVFGVLNSIEGCDTFGDAIENTQINTWYRAMKSYVDNKKGMVAT